MQAKDLQRHKDRLLQMRNRSREEINRMIDVVREDAPVGEHDHKVSESIDKELVLEHTEESIRAAVVEALKRIDDGTFGQCQECGASISKARLDALPFAAYCIHCERRMEQ